MRKAYGSSKSLIQVTSICLQDAADTLQCICDLNALPLALQITQVAGNVMSRTLLGLYITNWFTVIFCAFFSRVK